MQSATRWGLQFLTKPCQADSSTYDGSHKVFPHAPDTILMLFTIQPPYPNQNCTCRYPIMVQLSMLFGSVLLSARLHRAASTIRGVHLEDRGVNRLRAGRNDFCGCEAG